MNSIVCEIDDVKGYEFPFEGEKHLATIVSIPYRRDTWRDNASFALKEYLEVVKAISRFEKVVCIIDPRIDSKIVSLFQIENVHILRLRYDDSWARDNTPVFLKSDKRLVGVDFGFNAWGGDICGLYKPWDDDNSLSKNLLLELMISRYQDKGFILEGGSIHTNGSGTLLTTSECLLSKSRNPSLSKDEIEERLKRDLQVKKVLFLPYGVYQDETSGHVDNIACFLDEKTILLATTDDREDPQYNRSQEDLKYLEGETDTAGNSFNIIEMPLPKPLYMSKEEASGLELSKDAINRLEGRRLAGSYVNFYMGEKFLLVPQFNVEEDSKAIEILQDFYKDSKEIIPIHSREILLGGGNIHCITKQIPYMDGYPLFAEDEDR